MPGSNEFSPLASLILEVIQDPHFPKRQKARINFLADSVAGVGLVTPRRSRDICAEERAAKEDAKSATHILRYGAPRGMFVHRGHSENHACRDCGAKISQ